MLSILFLAALAVGAPPRAASGRAIFPGPEAAGPATATAQPASPAAGPAPSRQAAGEGRVQDAGTLELGALGGYAVGKVYDPQRTPSQFGQLLLRFAIHFGPTGSGMMRGNVSIVAEGVGIAVNQDPRAWGGGLNLLFRYTWAGQRWQPSFLGGAGVLRTDRQVPPGETRRNFTPQAGIGLRYRLTPRLALGGEYRFHHLSNKGKTETNPGINSHLVLFGLSWFR